jgi:hypothetical protein
MPTHTCVMFMQTLGTTEWPPCLSETAWAPARPGAPVCLGARLCKHTRQNVSTWAHHMWINMPLEHCTWMAPVLRNVPVHVPVNNCLVVKGATVKYIYTEVTVLQSM